MRFNVTEERRPATNGLDGTVIVLADSRSGSRAEVWPALGGNCYRWQAACGGRLLDLLYSVPNLFDDVRPTRSGIPVLFPFPNRIREGTFSWAGKTYRLPLNGPAKRNAIHGFACRHPWRMVDRGGDDQGAWITAEFHCATDAAADLPLWPADHRIRITHRLGDGRLSLAIRIDNPDLTPLPFGVGFHPYFRLPLVPGARKEDCFAQAQAERFWELTQNLPSGTTLPVDAARNLTQPRAVTTLTLDDVLIAKAPARTEPLRELGSLVQKPEGVELRLLASPAFRELVVFTPPHGDAFCLEPYSCTTDAINLQQHGSDAGLLVLPPGGVWQGVVELELNSG